MSARSFETESFAPRTSAAAIEELRARLRATRWPEVPPDADWSLGADTGYLRELLDYWAEGYDWSAQEAVLNALPRLRASVGGLRIHAIHARAAARPAFPLILSHGWPDSFWRYLKVIPLLTDPVAHGGDAADAFDVVVPDVPGFGYSEPPAGAPLDSIRVAGLWAELMTGLGYERFGAAGGDIGSHVSRYLALDFPERVIAVHRTDAGLPSPATDPTRLGEEERAWLQDVVAWSAREGAYAAMHRTKPDTAAVGLSDSPAGLAAWVVEKLRSWSDRGLEGYTKDEILTNLSIYWFTGSIGPSMRMYHANAAIPPEQLARHVEVPSGFSIFGGDVVRPPRAWLERTTNLVYATEPEHGGHFAAFEEPELYAHELREFFRPFRGESG